MENIEGNSKGSNLRNQKYSFEFWGLGGWTWVCRCQYMYIYDFFQNQLEHQVEMKISSRKFSIWLLISYHTHFPNVIRMHAFTRFLNATSKEWRGNILRNWGIKFKVFTKNWIQKTIFMLVNSKHKKKEQKLSLKQSYGKYRFTFFRIWPGWKCVLNLSNL